MSYCYLELRKEQNIAFIDLWGHLSKQENVLELADELAEACREINFDSGIHAVVLKGIENDGSEPISGFPKRHEGSNKDSISVTEPVGNLACPVLAEMNGPTIALGLELALACDIRVTGKSARFGFPHVQYGLIPGDGGTQRLARVVGQAKAMEMILTGELIDAEEAYRIGLVSKVVPHDAAMTTAMEIAQTMASKGPIALRYAKEAIHKGMDLTLEQGLRLEADLYFLLHTTKDRTEGIKAFREKRKPEFEGR